ncbi:MAG TPA: UDP-3-O-(3-hydroxymyristoyl)glucosamine N-acyltransferase [Candidatus Omnitrophica bacterium]|nr:MAG: UDP-3-O-(3-hydroxymyristoyl)glucosamine N-acyltransferase [Omnitrophica WOR_2 bacterium GWA2_45_18]OGX18844.1 MAG: UDP-3-O-(3-hydroxymyristoyl)glucosamine N-acyltransferase [Omnitrophica WOR_2 bacterium GWC2_45_7]HBR14886.1 UDP-3-O-(3-hydroxymyristoyl)glucosamine N-acyltransferase [Candidatus Omnitrophota bacterium]
MHKTLAEIASLVDGEFVGDGNLILRGLSGVKEAKEGDLTFVVNSKFLSLCKITKASAIIIPRDMEITGKPFIRTDNPSIAFSKIVGIVSECEIPFHPQGIHKTAVIGQDVILGENVAVGPFTVIEQGVRIGDNTIIYSGCYVGPKTIIGQNCLIYPQVTIRDRTSIGSRVIIHSGTVIGADGFGYEQVNGVHQKIPQIGTVQIEDDVEIGVNVAIDRARFDKTIIGKGTKIDNLVQIGHNVVIGENCIITAQVGISGSTTVGNGAILAGQVGVVGHIKIGEGAVVASRAVVMKSVPPQCMVSGFPARPHAQAKRVNACLQRLPYYVRTIHELMKRIEELEKDISKR